MTKEQLLDEAKALDPRRRAERIEDLRQITGDELTPELRAEPRRRVEAIDRREATFIPGAQVMRETRGRLNRQ